VPRAASCPPGVRRRALLCAYPSSATSRLRPISVSHSFESLELIHLLEPNQAHPLGSAPDTEISCTGVAQNARSGSSAYFVVEAHHLHTAPPSVPWRSVICKCKINVTP